jgi:hypothetical protein
MICHCWTCGTYLLTHQETVTVSIRLRSLLNPPTCPRCNDEIPNRAFQPANCLFCKQLGSDTLVQTPNGDRAAHTSCVEDADAVTTSRRTATSYGVELFSWSSVNFA